MALKIYFIPGLGADRRMYTPQLRVFNNAEVLEHLPPVKGQSLREYAGRLLPLINTEQPFALVGTSLGGIISLELTRHISPQKVVLLASVKGRSELPLFIRSMRYLNLHRALKGDVYKRFNTLLVKRLDSRRDSTVATLIRDMTTDARPEFIEWAINAVINWQPQGPFRDDVVHIHGTNDQLFPYSKVRNAIPVKNGSHVMNLTMSAEVNRILKQVLEVE